MKSTFNSKETYLVWRSEWRADYKALSEAIRETKYGRWHDNALRNTPGLISQAQTARYRALALKHGSPRSPAMAVRYGPQAWFPDCALIHLRVQAAAMLEMRKESKAEAQRQYLAAHAIVAVL